MHGSPSTRCTPKKTVECVRDLGASAIFPAKGNQKVLKACCERRSRFPCQDTHRTVDKHHGCVVERMTKTWCIPAKEKARFWSSFATVIRTTRKTHPPKGSPRTEVVFHLATAPVSAAFAAELIRGHWCIENAWHGLRDLGFHEDASQATGLTARGFAWARSAAINLARLLRTEPTKAQRETWRDPRKLFAWFKV